MHVRKRYFVFEHSLEKLMFCHLFPGCYEISRGKEKDPARDVALTPDCMYRAQALNEGRLPAYQNVVFRCLCCPPSPQR